MTASSISAPTPTTPMVGVGADSSTPAGSGSDGRTTTPAGAQLVITVYGIPGPQGSKKPKGLRVTKNGNLVSTLVESSAKVEPWRQDVRAAALKVTGTRWAPLDGPLALHVVFTSMRPKGHYRTGRNAYLLRDSAPARPDVRPDISKLIRSTEDALTSAGTWADDSRVVEIFAEKRFANEGPDALDRPGAVIRIRTIGGET